MHKKENAIIFLNGILPEKKVINHYIKSDSLLVSADGASNSLFKINVTPDVIIGDMDSIKHEVNRFFINKGVVTIKLFEQETTDFEKAIKYCILQNLNNIWVFGATSMRADHSLNNFSILKRYSKIINIKFVDNIFEIFFINKKLSFNYKKNEVVSILPLPFEKNITTKGLKYKLKNDKLGFGIREGTLNISTSKKVIITGSTNNILIFKKHFIIKDKTINGHF